MNYSDKWEPVYFKVDPVASVYPLVPNADYISPDEDFAPVSVRLAHHQEWGALLDKNRLDPMSERSLGMVSKVASLLGRGWLLCVPDTDPSYYMDDDGACGRAESFLWVHASDLVPA